ncbi:MAG TPA: N-acetyl-gamma-glutamyl-phosphate reductase [Candidatus Limnocylindrales bacterium]|nr:N-acetyl-gamma-glutamyl-phosphate reductase [Candidatus Limnocylindrales bacterium]
MRERAGAPVSAGIETGVEPGAGIEAASGVDPGTEVNRRPASDQRVRVGIVGATGYVGAELIRLLGRHPRVEVVGLEGRDRHAEPIGKSHPHLAGTGLTVESSLPPVDAVFLALPHGAAATFVPAIVAMGTAVIDLGPDFRLRDPDDYPTWYGFDHPDPQLLGTAVYGLPELHRDELRALRHAQSAVVGSPGCYPTATLLALAPLARAGLIGDLVVDAKSGVSGAGRDLKQHLMFGEVNESVSAYGIGGHRHTAEIEQELVALGRAAGVSNPGAAPVDFLPHLIPMTRGILAACHVRPTRLTSQDELDDLYAAAYSDEPFVSLVEAPPATKHVVGSNHARVFVRYEPRTDRILAIGVIDNLVKGAAGQAVQAFNLVHGLAETLGLEQLPMVP